MPSTFERSPENPKWIKQPLTSTEQTRASAQAMGRSAFKTAAEANRYLQILSHELAGNLFMARWTKLPDGRTFQDVGWGKKEAEELLSGAFDRYEELSKKERAQAQELQDAARRTKATHEALTAREVDQVIARSNTPRQTDKQVQRVQELENQKLVAEQRLRELTQPEPGQDSLWGSVKSFFRRISGGSEAQAEIEALRKSMEKLKYDLQAVRSEIREEIKPTYLQSPSEAKRNLARDTAAAFLPGIESSMERDARLRTERDQQNRLEPWEEQARNAERRRIQRHTAFALEQDARQEHASRTPERRKEAQEEWDAWQAELDTEHAARKQTPKETSEQRRARREREAETGFIYSPSERARNLGRDMGANLLNARMEDTDTRERKAQYDRELSLGPMEFTDADAFSDSLLGPVNMEELRGSELLRISSDDLARIERTLREHDYDPAREWARINTLAQRIPDAAQSHEFETPTEKQRGKFAYNFANAYIENLAQSFSSNRRTQSIAKRNLETLDRYLQQQEAKKQERYRPAARRPAPPRPDIFDGV